MSKNRRLEKHIELSCINKKNFRKYNRNFVAITEIVLYTSKTNSCGLKPKINYILHVRTWLKLNQTKWIFGLMLTWGGPLHFSSQCPYNAGNGVTPNSFFSRGPYKAIYILYILKSIFTNEVRAPKIKSLRVQLLISMPHLAQNTLTVWQSVKYYCLIEM